MAAPCLRDLWLAGPEGKLCAREEAKAWGLRAAWEADSKGAYGMLSFVAQRLKKTRRGKPRGGPPSVAAVQQFFAKVDSDPDWFPGKHDFAKRGPKRVLRGAKASAVVSAAKRMKVEGEEPTYAAVVAACPAATLNPATQQPVDKKRVYALFREACADDGATDMWDHYSRLSRAALTDVMKEKRLAFAIHMLSLGHSPGWYSKNLVWCDLCNSVLPRTKKKAQELALARKGGKGWMSQSSRQHSQNLRLPKALQKMNSSDTAKVWWVPILARGKLHIDLLPDSFPGETEAGAALMVAKVRAALNIRFQGSTAPRHLFTDRGNGFYVAGSGKITAGYRAALQEHGLTAFFRDDAGVQPGTLQEMMLHETAVAWVRARLAKTVPRQAWAEPVAAYCARLKGAATYINDNYDVVGLCGSLPARLKALRACGGDRLPQ